MKYFRSLLLLLSICTLSLNHSEAASGGDWIDGALKARRELKAELAKEKMPVKSSFVKCGDKAETITADVTGLDKLYLYTESGMDGYYKDITFWANGTLTKADGTVVSLDSYPTTKVRLGTRRFQRNMSPLGGKAIIGGETFDKTLMCCPSGMLEYKLGGDFVKFEAQVGVDNRSSDGSAYFNITSISLDQVSADLEAKYGANLSIVGSAMTNLCAWLLADDVELEKMAAINVAAKIKENSYYKKLIAEVDGLKSNDAKTRRYFEIIVEMNAAKSLAADLEWLNPAAVELAFNDMKQDKGYDAAKYQPMLTELLALAKEGFSGINTGDKAAIARGEKALELKRQILLGNTLLDGDKILASRYVVGSTAKTIMAPQLGTQNNNWSNQQSASRSGFNADIVELSNLRGDMSVRSVYKPEGTAPIADLRLHWDGTRAMFSSTQEDGRWNVYEVGLDGDNLHKFLDVPEDDLEFYDGTYLPDGRIIVTSNIGYQGVPCVNGNDPVGNMMIFDPSNKGLRRLTFDQDANWNPTINHQGKVMYTRWEYTDLTHYYSRIVMTMNPDGTEQRALYGSGSMFPNSTFDMQSLPGHQTAFVGIISGHHGIARSGRLILFDPAKSRKGVDGMLQEIPYKDKVIEEEIKDQLVNGVWPQFIKPSPLNDKYFLVAAKLNEDALWGIYLVDVFDNVTCIHKGEGEGYITPIAVRQTPTPPTIPDRIIPDSKEATVFIQDIYEGEGLIGVPRGSVKEVRILAYEYAYVKSLSDHNWHGIQSGWDIKRLLGTVPVEEDGSVIFKVPANTPIAIQPIGADGAAIQWMRSWFTAMPGETVSCTGCHEDLNQIAMPKRVIASQKQPVAITAPEGGVRSFTFELEIQPILDRACVACHNGEKAFNLKDHGRDRLGFSKSYLNFHPYIHRQGGEGDMAVLYPYEYHPNTSELVRLLKNGHGGIELTDKEWRTLYNWIDFNAPDKGYFNANPIKGTPYCGYDQIQRRKELNDIYANGMGVDWQKEIADYAAYLESKGEIKPATPVKNTTTYKDQKQKGWQMSESDIKALLAKEESTKKCIDLGNGLKMNFVRIPAGKFVMGSNKGATDSKPESKVTIAKSFWMGEIEVSNEQFNAVFPDHFSKYMDEQWKDHVDQGYPAFEPQQPVIRVSWGDAMEYCKILSEKSGLNITLPTEAQWEWACRAGADSDFWYGTKNSDFGKKENLADKTTLLFAVDGVNPQPMKPSNSLYEHYIFLPKEESVDDGNLIQVAGAQYDANAFGLYDMHGNVAEWTRSDYLPYPYKASSKESAEYKVARGGSFIDRPKMSTSHTRKGYYPHQRVFNVGFRVIIED